MVAPDVGDHYLHALADEHPRHSQADSAGPAGDECDFVFHVFHFSLVSYGIWFLSIKCANAIHRRGGFSPSASVFQAIGRGKPAPTMLGALFFQTPYAISI